MVESITSQGYQLNIETKYYNKLDIQGFSQMLKDPSYCYKFYWLEAVVHLISEGKTDTIWAGQELYRKGNSKDTFYKILEKNMMPVYDSARRQGYEIWGYC